LGVEANAFRAQLSYGNNIVCSYEYAGFADKVGQQNEEYLCSSHNFGALIGLRGLCYAISRLKNLKLFIRLQRLRQKMRNHQLFMV